MGVFRKIMKKIFGNKYVCENCGEEFRGNRQRCPNCNHTIFKPKK